MKNNTYLLFFKDFNPDKENRQPSMQIRLTNKTLDTKEQIAKKLSGIESGTSFIRRLGMTTGYWGLISIIPESQVIEVSYEEK